jgi:glutamyl-tRNA reductase
MHITLVGISHKTAPVAVRERFAFSADELPEALPKFGGAAVLVSTCNRTEVYMIAHHAIAPGSVIAMLRDLKSDVEAPDDVFYHKTGLDAVRHLFRVAAGIESMVLGESEILGQVSTAFSAATAANTHNAVISQLFHTAIRVGRKARSETAIGRHAVSISSTATKLAEKTLGDLPSRNVLVVSAGEAGALAARSMTERGVKHLLVTSRRPARAKELAKDLGGRPVPFKKLGATMADSDIVITSSAAPGFLIGQPEVDEATAKRNGRPLLLIDIAVPRDVDPVVRSVSNVQLYDMDDLQALVEEGRSARKQEVAKVDKIVEEGLERFRTWMRDRGVVPTVAVLRERADAVRQTEVEKTFQRHSDLTDKQRRSIEAMSSALVKKLLHEPIVRLKSDDGERYVVPVRELFKLDVEQDQDSPPEG